MSRWNPNVCTPCTTCKIRECKKNRNPEPNMDSKPLIDKLKEEANFKRIGCPHRYRD